MTLTIPTERLGNVALDEHDAAVDIAIFTKGKLSRWDAPQRSPEFRQWICSANWGAATFRSSMAWTS